MNVPKVGRMKRPAKRGVTTRLWLMLLDGKPHSLSEFWDFIASGVEPHAAARKALYRYNRKNHVRSCTLGPEELVQEGIRVAVMQTISHMENNGWVVSVYPEPTVRHNKAPGGYIEARNVVLVLTEKGFSHVMEGDGIWTKVCVEMYLALKSAKITVQVRKRESV